MSGWEPPATVRRRARAKFMGAWIPQWVRALSAWNRFARRRVVDARSSIDVSLTTFGPRAALAYLTIESIGLGTRRPRRIVLWVDDADLASDPPSTLRRLEKRGLEIRLAQNFGPHTKYFPYCASEGNGDQSLVTADDDLLYPPRWLKTLEQTHFEHPDDIVCHRAHVRSYNADGTIGPYRTWGPCLSAEASRENMATGVSGVLYPAPFVRRLAELGTAFMDVCPRADDVWLHYAARDSRHRVRQCRAVPRIYAELPGSQVVNLSTLNDAGGENDGAISRTEAHFEVIAHRKLGGS